MSILCSELKLSIVGTHDAEFCRENKASSKPYTYSNYTTDWIFCDFVYLFIVDIAYFSIRPLCLKILITAREPIIALS